MKCAIQMTKLSIILLHGLLIIIEMSIETLQGEKNSFTITIRRRRCSRAWTVLYTWYFFFRSFFESFTYKSSQRKIRRKIVQTRISKRWIHIKDTKHRWMVLLLFFSPSFTTFFLRSIFQTHTDIYMSVCSAQVHTYTVHTNSKCFQLCSILFCFRASLHLCSSCKRAKVRHLAFFCILLLFSFLIGFFLFLSLLPCL